MKKLPLLFILFTIFACNANIAEESAVENTPDVSHESEVSHDLVGKIDRSALNQTPYQTWFASRYEDYSPDEAIISELQEVINNYQVKAFMGTWCHDSKREVPRLLKILDSAKFDSENFSLIALDRSKQTPEKLEKDSDIQRTPSFIFYENGEEIGRIVETPRESIEKDILKIVLKQGYKHSYQE